MIAYNGTIVEGHRRYSIEELNNTIRQIEDDNIQYLLMRQERKSKRNNKNILSKLLENSSRNTSNKLTYCI